MLPRRPGRLGLLTVLGGIAIAGSLFLTWYHVSFEGEVEPYSGWLAFDRTDRALAALALAMLACGLLQGRRRLAVLRLAVGLSAIAIVLRELVSPPVAYSALGPGGGLALGGATATVLAGVLGFAPASAKEWLDARMSRLRPRSQRRARSLSAAGSSARGATVRAGGALRDLVLQGVPALSPGALGLYRVGLGSALFLSLVLDARARVYAAPFPRELHGEDSWFTQPEIVHRLASSPDAIVVLLTATLLAVGLFTVGAFARAAYVLSVAGICLHVLVGLLAGTISHDWGLPVVCLVVLLVVPWGRSGIGVDAAVRRWRGRAPENAATQQLGLAVWLPGLCVGVAWAAAAYSKMHNTGVAWIVDGAVAYAFIQDAGDAPVDWGGRLAAEPVIAVALSLGAVLTESLFFLHLFFASERVRFAFFVLGAGLLAGFWLFQGVFWLPWWALLTALLPWQGAYRSLAGRIGGGVPAPIHSAAAGRARAAATALAIGALLVSQQVAVSAVQLEQLPFLSSFPMYSHTYPSRAAFIEATASKNHRYRYAVVDGKGDLVDVTDELTHLPRVDATLQEAFLAKVGETEVDGEERIDLARRLRGVTAAYRAAYGRELREVRIVRLERPGYDWRTHAFDDRFAPAAARTISVRRFAADGET